MNYNVINNIQNMSAQQICITIGFFLVMILIGLLITHFVHNGISNKIAFYRKAVELTKDDEFQYGLKTSVGPAFSFGTLRAVDPVSVYWADGEYMLCKRVREEYTRHERVVTRTDYGSDGKTTEHEEVEVYYTWDVVWTDEINASLVSFCGVQFSYDLIKMPAPHFYGTSHEGIDVRYQEYVLPASMQGTVYADLFENTLSKGARFFENKQPEEAKEKMVKEQNRRVTTFWFIWIAVMICYGFLVLLAHNKPQ